MTDPSLDERLRAVERALTETDRDLTGIADATDLADRIEAIDDRLATVEDQVTELEAAVQAVRGYVGGVRAVNREVEDRADEALATARAVERRLDGSPTADGRAIERDDPATGRKNEASASHVTTTDRPPESTVDRNPATSTDGDPATSTDGDPSTSTDGDPATSTAPDPPTSTVQDPSVPGTGVDDSDGRDEIATDRGGTPTPDPDRVPDPWGDPPWESPTDDSRGGEDEPAGDGGATAGSASVLGPARDPSNGGREAGSDRPEPSDPHTGSERSGPSDEEAFEGWWVPDRGVEVDRTEPWSVPDPIDGRSEEGDAEPRSEGGDESLLERFREAL